jgi:hypothetical protein
LDAFEEGVVFGGAGGGFFVRVVAQDLFAVGAADLVFGCFIAETREAEDGVVVLVLEDDATLVYLHGVKGFDSR